ncbi:MAG: hypothetical protein WC785_03400 [Tatlockia sp.]|jgi:hypothetical protein
MLSPKNKATVEEIVQASWKLGYCQAEKFNQTLPDENLCVQEKSRVKSLLSKASGNQDDYRALQKLSLFAKASGQISSWNRTLNGQGVNWSQYESSPNAVEQNNSLKEATDHYINTGNLPSYL